MMNTTQRVDLAKRLIQKYIDSKGCQTMTAVESTLDHTRAEDILAFAEKNGQHVNAEDRSALLKSINDCKTFYSASPAGSQSYFRVN